MRNSVLCRSKALRMDMVQVSTGGIWRYSSLDPKTAPQLWAGAGLSASQADAAIVSGLHLMLRQAALCAKTWCGKARYQSGHNDCVETPFFDKLCRGGRGPAYWVSSKVRRGGQRVSSIPARLGPAIILMFCSSWASTATCTEFHRAADWNVKTEIAPNLFA